MQLGLSARSQIGPATTAGSSFRLPLKSTALTLLQLFDAVRNQLEKAYEDCKYNLDQFVAVEHCLAKRDSFHDRDGPIGKRQH